MSTIAKSLRLSTQATDGEARPHVNCPTRWNSQLTMIKSILKIPSHELDNLCLTTRLSDDDYILLEELVEILSPFETVTDLLQGEVTATASMVLPCINQLFALLDDLYTKFPNQVVGCLRDISKVRLAKYSETDFFHIATYLDPRFKASFMNSDAREQLSRLLPPSNLHSDDSSPPSKRPRFFTVLSQTPSTHKTKSEIDLYEEEPLELENVCPLSYWRVNTEKFPLLSSLARVYLAPPASSAPVERLFSIDDKAFCPDMCRLGDCTFNNLMLVRAYCNSTK